MSAENDTSWLMNGSRWSTINKYIEGWEREDEIIAEVRHTRILSQSAFDAASASVIPVKKDVVISPSWIQDLPIIQQDRRIGAADLYHPKPVTIPEIHEQAEAIK